MQTTNGEKETDGAFLQENQTNFTTFSTHLDFNVNTCISGNT